MTVSTPRRRPGHVLLRRFATLLATSAMLALPSLAAPSFAWAATPTLSGHWTSDQGSGTTGISPSA